MKTPVSRFATGVLIATLAAITCTIAYGQEPPLKIRLAEIHVRNGQTADFEVLTKLVNDAYQKAGVAWRETWSVSLFGEGGVYYLVSPVKSYAQFDEDGPITKLSVEDRLKYANLSRNAVESAHYKMIEVANDLSLVSDRKEPPKMGRITTLRTLPGKAPELDAAIKDVLLPALKAGGVKDFWVYRTLVGGPIGEYTYLLLFDKWADLDAMGSMQKLLGASYDKYLAAVSKSVAGAENMVIKLDPKLSYFPQN